MGAYGIFVAILTFVLIIYYAVTIGMDLLGSKGKKKEEVEVFNVGDSGGEDIAEQPTVVSEGEDPYKEAVTEKAEEVAASAGQLPEDNRTAEEIAADIMSADKDELYKAIKDCEGKMEPIIAESEDEVTPDEYDNFLSARLDNVEELTDNMEMSI